MKIYSMVKSKGSIAQTKQCQKTLEDSLNILPHLLFLGYAKSNRSIDILITSSCFKNLSIEQSRCYSIQDNKLKNYCLVNTIEIWTCLGAHGT